LERNTVHPGDRVSFNDPIDGPCTGTVTTCEPGIGREAVIAFVSWDDGDLESGVFADDLVLTDE
jgi:hypothetical protein